MSIDKSDSEKENIHRLQKVQGGSRSIEKIQESSGKGAILKGVYS